MFVGHYAAAYALKAKQPNASLAILFIAVQFVDILFFPFVLLGFEKLEFVKDFTAVNNFQMDYYPFTHGLVASLIWAVIAYVLFAYVLSKGKQIALVVALAVLSHWFIDVIAHTADLPLLAGEPKFGFGLWHNKTLAFIVEIALLVFGYLWYLKKTQTQKEGVNFANWIFLLFLIVVNYLNFYVLPATEDIRELTTSALLSFFVLAGFAFFVDRTRKAKTI